MDNIRPERPQERPDLEILEQLSPFLRTHFDNIENVRNLARGRQSLDSFWNELAENETADTQEMAIELINVIGQDTERWGQDQRDAALNLLEQVCMAGIAIDDAHFNRMEIVKAYAQAVKELPPESDYFGAPYSLYETGQLLGKELGNGPAHDSYHARLLVGDAWGTYFGFAQGPDIPEEDRASGMIEEVVRGILPVAPQEATSWEFSRTGPELSYGIQNLHDTYLFEVASNKSFKRRLHEATPNHEQFVETQGLKRAELWNLSDPNVITQGLATFLENTEAGQLRDRFERHVQKICGLSLQELADKPTLAAIYADQLVHAANGVRAEIALKSANPQELCNRLVKQTTESLTARKPNAKLKPIRNLLEQAGLSYSQSPQELVEFMQHPDAQQQIIEYLRHNNTLRENEQAYLAELFPTPPYRFLRFMNRDEYDMYSGDFARDCTAYHLANGFNAWTVPLWLSNPDMMLAYPIDPESQREVAKIGFTLAHDGEQLRIVVDSLEAYKELPDQARALRVIQQGILELQQWADERGLGDVFFCTYSNSTELITSIPVCASQRTTNELQLVAQDSTTGLHEAASALTTSDAFRRQPYLQSRQSEEEQVNAEVAAANLSIQDALVQFERILASAKSEELFELARAGDIDGAIVTFVKKRMPLTYQVFGDNAFTYREAFDHLAGQRDVEFAEVIAKVHQEIQHTDLLLRALIHPDRIEPADLSGAQFNLEFYEWFHERVTVRDIEPLLSEEGLVQLRREARNLNELMNTLKELNEYISTETAFERVFGIIEEIENREEEEIQRTLRLRTDLPVVNRDFL